MVPCVLPLRVCFISHAASFEWNCQVQDFSSCGRVHCQEEDESKVLSVTTQGTKDYLLTLPQWRDQNWTIEPLDWNNWKNCSSLLVLQWFLLIQDTFQECLYCACYGCHSHSISNGLLVPCTMIRPWIFPAWLSVQPENPHMHVFLVGFWTLFFCFLQWTWTPCMYMDINPWS